MVNNRQSYSDVICEVIKIKSAEALLDPALFFNCVRDVAGQSWSTEFKVAERNLNANMLSSYYSAAQLGTNELRATSKKVAEELQFDCGLAKVVAESIAYGMGDALTEHARMKELYAEGERLLTMGRYLDAHKAFQSIGSYEDAETRVLECEVLASRERDYELAVANFDKAADEKEFLELAKAFEGFSGYKASDALKQKCLEFAKKSNEAEKVYQEAKVLLLDENFDSHEYEAGARQFETISWYKDSTEKLRACELLADKARTYEGAVEVSETEPSIGNLSAAASSLEALGDFRDSKTLAAKYRDEISRMEYESDFEKAKAMFNSAKKPEEFEKSALALHSFGDYKNAKELAERAESEAEEARKRESYSHATRVMNSSKRAESYEKAAQLFEELGNFSDSQDKAIFCREAAGKARKQEEQKRNEDLYSNAIAKMKSAVSSNDYYAAKRTFMTLADYRDSGALAKECEELAENHKAKEEAEKLESRYNAALEKKSTASTEGEYTFAANLFGSLKPYKDSERLETECKTAAEVARKKAIIKDATSLLENANRQGSLNISETKLLTQIERLESIENWENAEDLKKRCTELLRKKRRENKAAKRKHSSAEKWKDSSILWGLALICILAILTWALTTYVGQSTSNNEPEIIESVESTSRNVAAIVENNSSSEADIYENPAGFLETEIGKEIVALPKTGDWDMAKGALSRITFGDIEMREEHTVWDSSDRWINTEQEASEVLTIALVQMSGNADELEDGITPSEIWTWNDGVNYDVWWVFGTVVIDNKIWRYRINYLTSHSNGQNSCFSVIISDAAFDPPYKDALDLKHYQDGDWQTLRD